MKWETADESSVVTCQTTALGEFVIPDAGSLTVTLRDHTGAVLAGYDALSLPDVALPLVQLVVPSGINAIDPAGLAETRYVKFSFTVSGLPYSQSANYRLTPFLPIQKNAQNVRDLLGAAETELPDSAIDLIEAYFKLADEVGVAFTAAMIATTRANICANNMVALQAAITTIPAMQTRLLKSEKSHDEGFERSKIDFAKLEVDLVAQLAGETASMIDGTVIAVSSPAIFAVTTPTDIITGA